VTTIDQAIRQATRQLQPASESAALDARLLLAHVLGVSTTALYRDARKVLTPALLEQFDTCIERRAAGEPIAYITGHCGFWTLDLMVNADVLIPRPDTETVVQAALNVLPDTALTLADLGTGSGAIALALASERPQWTVTATDISAPALACARANARRLQLDRIRFVPGRWFDPLEQQRFHAIVANPPYVALGDSHLDAPELRHEPQRALVAGNNGLAELAYIIRHATDHLEPGGSLLLEHGYDQAGAVAGQLARAGFRDIDTHTDLAGRARVTLGRRG